MKEKWQNQHDTGEAPWDYNEFDVDFKEELYRVMVHGLLHLLKYIDNSKTEQKLMREKENYYLEKIT